jgi:hypothetical protein
MWPKMKHGLHFYTCSLSLTLNSAFTSLSGGLGGDCLGTLNPKLLRIRCKFFEKTYPVLQT